MARLSADIPQLADLFTRASHVQEASGRWKTYDELKQQGIPLIERSPLARAWSFSIQQAIESFCAELDRLLPEAPVENLLEKDRRWWREQEEEYGES